MALMPGVFPGLPPAALDKMNGEMRQWTELCDVALALPTEEQRWLALGRVFMEASELAAAATERLAEEEGLPEDERGVGTVVCADGSRVFLVNGLALHVFAAPLEGASFACAEVAAAKRRLYRDEQRIVQDAWGALLRTGQGNGTRLAMPLLMLSTFRGLSVAACAVWPAETLTSSAVPDADLKGLNALLADAPPHVRALRAKSEMYRAQGSRMFLTAPLAEALLPRDALWPTLTPLPALLTPADPSQPIRVELIPRIGWADAVETLLGRQHEAWPLAASPHSLFYQPAPAPVNARAAKLYLGAGLKTYPSGLRGTVLFVPRFRETAVLVRPELGLSAQSSAQDVSSALQTTLDAFSERLNNDSPAWPWQLVELMHAVGLPVRYLGLVRQCVREARVKRLLLVEATVRALKTRLLQRQSKQSMSASNNVILQFFNAMLGDGPRSERLWRTHIPQLIAWKYPLLLNNSEIATTDLRTLLVHHRLALLRGVQRAVGVRIKDALESRLLEASSLRLAGLSLGMADIALVAPITHAPVLPHAELLRVRLTTPTEKELRASSSAASASAGGSPMPERKASSMDPRVLAQRGEDEAAGWVFVERNAARRQAGKPKGPPVPPTPEHKPASDNCTIQ